MDRTLGQPESKVIPFPRPENDAATRLARQRHGSKPCDARAKLWLGIWHGWDQGLGKYHHWMVTQRSCCVPRLVRARDQRVE